MEAFLNGFEPGFVSVIKIAYHLVEILGLIIILVSVIKGVIGYFRKDPTAKTELGKGIMFAIELLIGAEVMHTIIAEDLSQLAGLGVVVVVRIVLTLVLHWEVTEKEEKKEKEKEKITQGKGE